MCSLRLPRRTSLPHTTSSALDCTTLRHIPTRPYLRLQCWPRGCGWPSPPPARAALSACCPHQGQPPAVDPHPASLLWGYRQRQKANWRMWHCTQSTQYHHPDLVQSGFRPGYGQQSRDTHCKVTRGLHLPPASAANTLGVPGSELLLCCNASRSGKTVNAKSGVCRRHCTAALMKHVLPAVHRQGIAALACSISLFCRPRHRSTRQHCSNTGNAARG